MGRLFALAGGVAWLVAMAVIAIVIQWSIPPRPVPRLPTVPPIIKELNAGRSGVEGESWVVRRATTAHHILVVDVDVAHISDARAIAAQIIEPVLDRGYEEILVYIWKAGGQGRFANRRIQWTPSGGYTELVIDE